MPSDAELTAFGPDDRTVIVRDGATMSLYDRVAGRRTRAIPAEADLLALGGGVLATYHDGEIRLWQPASLRPLGAPMRSGKIDMLAVSPDGSTIAVAADRSIRYWDIRTHRLTGTTLTGHRDTITALGFTSDGTRLWTLAGDDTGRLWNTKLLAEIGDPITLSTGETAFESDSRVLSFSSDGRLLTVASGDELQQWTTHAERMPALPAGTLAVSPDGRTVAVEEAGRLVVKDRASGRRTGASLPLPDADMRLIAFSPDWRAVAISSTNDIRVWDVATGRPLSPIMTGHGEGYSGYDPDGTIVTGPIDGIVDMAFSPDRTTLVSAGVDGVLRFWDVATGRSTREAAYVTAVRIDSSGRYAVTLSLDPTDESFGEIRLWDRPPVSRSARPGRRTPVAPTPPRSVPTDASWQPEAVTARSGCGTCPPGVPLATRSKLMRAPSRPLYSARTGRSWRARATTGPYACGRPTCPRILEGASARSQAVP